jgi:hypothetical protein
MAGLTFVTFAMLFLIIPPSSTAMATPSGPAPTSFNLVQHFTLHRTPVTSPTTAAPVRATTQLVSAPAPAPPPPPPPAPAPAPPPPPTPAPAPAPVAIAPQWQYGCADAIAYLQTHANPAFTIECPGYAGGHEAMTCVNYSSECPNAAIIAIADPCPAAYMNEAVNSQAGGEQIDPYGSCDDPVNVPYD